MDNVATAQGAMPGAGGAVSAAQDAPRASVQQMPLSFLREGERATIAKLRGRGDLHHHLENLGFVEGAAVTVVSGVAGDLIVEVKGAQVAISRQVASHIITSAAR